MNVDFDRFAKAIEDVKRESGRSSEDMLRYTMVLMLTAGRNATKQGRKNRALIYREGDEVKDSENVDLKQPGVRFFRVYSQARHHVPRKVFVPQIPRKTRNNEAKRYEAMRARDEIVARFKTIKRRGIAKASWGWAMQRVSRSIKLAAMAETLAQDMRSNPIEVTHKLAGKSPFIEVINKLGWIRNLTPDIEQQMVNSAGRRLEHWLERRWQTGIDAASRRAT